MLTPGLLEVPTGLLVGEEDPVTASVLPVEKTELDEGVAGVVRALVFDGGKPVGYPGAELGDDEEPVTVPVLPVEKMALEESMIVSVSVLVVGVRRLVEYPGTEVGIEDPVTASVLPVETTVLDSETVNVRVVVLGVSVLLEVLGDGEDESVVLMLGLDVGVTAEIDKHSVDV